MFVCEWGGGRVTFSNTSFYSLYPLSNILRVVFLCGQNVTCEDFALENGKKKNLSLRIKWGKMNKKLGKWQRKKSTKIPVCLYQSICLTIVSLVLRISWIFINIVINKMRCYITQLYHCNILSFGKLFKSATRRFPGKNCLYFFLSELGL